jgi:hypothetical protein
VFLEEEGIKDNRGGGCMRMCDGNDIKRCIEWSLNTKSRVLLLVGWERVFLLNWSGFEFW